MNRSAALRSTAARARVRARSLFPVSRHALPPGPRFASGFATILASRRAFRFAFRFASCFAFCFASRHASRFATGRRALPGRATRRQSLMRARLERWIGREWQRRGWLAWLLLPLAAVFGAIAAGRRLGFRLGWLARHSAGIPVVVVGNVTVGGTGKTPTVIALVEALRDAGFTPGVISRGYGGTGSAGAPLAVDERTDARQAGDEPALIARRTGVPVYVCRDRVAAAAALRRDHPLVDVLVSDDGLQHYRLARDVEIVVFDQRLGGNGFLLPAGPLREPLRRRRDATLINDPFGDSLPPWPDTSRLRLAPEAAWRIDAPAERRALSDFASQDVLAAAGIGAPERFFAMLRAAGIRPRTRAFPDHHAFGHDAFAADPAEAILVTEKDAVKCGGWHDGRLWAVPVRGVLDPRLIALVVEKVRGRSPA